MMERYRFAGILACAILVGLTLIILVQRVELPGGVSKVLRPPENGIGTRCAEGDESSCMKLCDALSNISTIKCVDHLAHAFPRVHDGKRLAAARGGGGSSGSQPASPPGGGAPATPATPSAPSPPASPSPQPPQAPQAPQLPPPTTPKPPPAPEPTGIVHQVCHLDPLLGRVCQLVPGLIVGL